MHNKDSPAFMHDVISAAADRSLPPAVRQLALLTVKNSTICKHDERLLLPLKECLPALLDDEDVSKIAALVLADAVVRGNSNAWFGVYTDLTQPWRPTEPILRFLSIVAQDGEGEMCVAMTDAAICAAHSVAEGDFGNDPERIRHCFIIVGRVLAVVGVQRNENFSRAINTLFTATLSVGFVSFNGQHYPELEWSDRSFELECECLKFFTAICHAIATEDNEAAASIAQPLVARTLASLEGNLCAFAYHTLREGYDVHEGMETYSTKLIELLEECLTAPALVPFAIDVIRTGSWKQTEGDSLELVHQLLIGYGIASAKRIDDWVANPNTYVQDDDDRNVAIGHFARDSALSSLCLLARHGALSTVIQVLSRILFSADGSAFAASLSSLGDQHATQWRLRESALCAVEMLIVRCKTKRFLAVGVDSMDELAQHVVAEDVLGHHGQPVAPIMQCRALAFLGTLLSKSASLLSADTITHLTGVLLPACASTIADNSTMPLLTMAAIRLLHPLLRKAPINDIIAGSGQIATALVGFIERPGVSAEVLYYALEALQVHASRSPISDGLERTPVVLCRAWKTNMNDPNLGELVVDVFSALTVGHSVCEESFHECLPWLAEVMQGCDDVGSMFLIPSILDIVGRVLRVGSLAIAGATYEVLLPPLFHLTLTNEDTSIVPCALRCIASVIERAGYADAAGFTVEILPSALVVPPGLPSLDEAPESAPLPDIVAAVLITVLGADRKPLALTRSGKSMSTLFAFVAGLNHPRTRDILLAFVQRAAGSRADYELQQVLYPLVCWINRDPEAALKAFPHTPPPPPPPRAVFFQKLLGHLQFFDGAALSAGVDLALGCMSTHDQDLDLVLKNTFVTMLAGGQQVLDQRAGGSVRCAREGAGCAARR
jgi:hypothetical protein